MYRTEERWGAGTLLETSLPTLPFRVYPQTSWCLVLVLRSFVSSAVLLVVSTDIRLIVTWSRGLQNWDWYRYSNCRYCEPDIVRPSILWSPDPRTSDLHILLATGMPLACHGHATRISLVSFWHIFWHIFVAYLLTYLSTYLSWTSRSTSTDARDVTSRSHSSTWISATADLSSPLRPL